MKFFKMHGLGNDFVFINQREVSGFNKEKINDIVLNVSKRNTGIGCDQVIFYSDIEGLYSMSIYNNNGSYATACGNASRCFAKLIFDSNIGLNAEKDEIIVDVCGRKIKCRKDTEKHDFFTINMGYISFNAEWIPKKNELINLFKNINIGFENSMCVDVGNKHLVIILDKISHSEISFFGKNLSSNELFIDGINVNFVLIQDNKLFITTYERGSGITKACGSGACASFGVANKLGFVKNKCKAVMELGELDLELKDDSLIMGGYVSKVAQGEYYYEK